MNLANSLTLPVFSIIGETADRLGMPVFVVGGYVRDIFLNRQSSDIDFVTVGSGIQLAKEVAASLGKKPTYQYSPLTEQLKSNTTDSNSNSSEQEKNPTTEIQETLSSRTVLSKTTR